VWVEGGGGGGDGGGGGCCGDCDGSFIVVLVLTVVGNFVHHSQVSFSILCSQMLMS